MNSSSQPTPIYSSLATDPDFAELIDLYVDEVQDRIQELKSCLASEDWHGLGTLAHQIKGAAGSHGFHGITQPAADLEAACRAAPHPASPLEPLDNLIDLLSRLEAGTAAPKPHA